MNIGKNSYFHNDMDRFIDEFQEKPLKLLDDGLDISFAKLKSQPAKTQVNQNKLSGHKLISSNDNRKQIVSTNWILGIRTGAISLVLDLFVVILSTYIVYLSIHGANYYFFDSGNLEFSGNHFPIFSGKLWAIASVGTLILFGAYRFLLYCFQMKSLGQKFIVFLCQNGKS